jgi:quercetin dioxygenase-like cupin family protein
MVSIKHCHYSDIKAVDVDMEGAKDVKLRMAVGVEDGAPNFIMRIFEVAPGGHTPHHTHDFEHENYVMDGEGILVKDDGSEEPLRPGDIAFVPPNVKHQYRNAGDKVLRFICLVPK